MKPRLAAVVAAMGLLAAACSSPSVFESLEPSTLGSASEPNADATSQTDPPLSSAGPSASTDSGDMPVGIEMIDCPDSLTDPAISCGLAAVPVDHSQPLGSTTKVSFAIMEGSDSGFDTPVAVLQGGPGGASSELATWVPQRVFTQVFVDQRGTGFGSVDFNCAEADQITTELLALDSATALARELAAYSSCAARLAGDPLLPATNTAAMAADVASVMNALGHDRWVVYGVSYGTTIALELLRSSVEGLFGAVLDGVYPPDIDVDRAVAFSADRSIAAVDSACRSDSGCKRVVEGVAPTLNRLIVELDADPIYVSAGGGAPETIIDGQRLGVFTFLMLYSEQTIARIPWMLAGLDRRDPDVARWAARVGNLILTSSSEAADEATYMAVQCHDRAPFTSGPPADLSEFASVIAAPPTSELCGPWSVGSAPPEVGRPVESDIPTLLLSGGLDPITPAVYARGVAKGLSRATVVEQDGRGHGIWFGNGCIAEIVRSFVSDPGRQLDTSCADRPVPVDWVLP